MAGERSNNIGFVGPPNMGGRMGTILMIMSVPFLYATGIYNPPVVHHGRCRAEPGTFRALLYGTHNRAAETVSDSIKTRH